MRICESCIDGLWLLWRLTLPALLLGSRPRASNPILSHAFLPPRNHPTSAVLRSTCIASVPRTATRSRPKKICCKFAKSLWSFFLATIWEVVTNTTLFFLFLLNVFLNSVALSCIVPLYTPNASDLFGKELVLKIEKEVRLEVFELARINDFFLDFMTRSVAHWMSSA